MPRQLLVCYADWLATRTTKPDRTINNLSLPQVPYPKRRRKRRPFALKQEIEATLTIASLAEPIISCRDSRATVANAPAPDSYKPRTSYPDPVPGRGVADACDHRRISGGLIDQVTAAGKLMTTHRS
jgi:hypothetical protein